MTYKNRRLVLLTTVLGVAFNFLPASPRAATLDQTEAPRVDQQSPRREAEDLQPPRGRTAAKPDETQAPRGTDAAPGEIQSPRGRVQVTVDDTQAPRGARDTRNDSERPRGETPAALDDTQAPHGGAATVGDSITGVAK